MDIKAFIKKDIGGLPVWAWILAGTGGIAVGLFLYRRSKMPTSASSTPDSTTSANTTDGGQAGYGDYQPAGSNAGNQTPTGATINIGVPATPSNWATSLILSNSHPINLYATAGQPGGLPDAVIGSIPQGSTVQATGPEVVGAWNVPNGSELWYPVVYNGSPGFVSAADVSNASTSINNQQVPTPPVTNYRIRPKGAYPTFDNVHDGVNLYNTPNKGQKVVGSVPFNSPITLVGPQVNGHYHIAGGYILAHDVVGP